MKKRDEFFAWLGSDAECSFSEWVQRREGMARRRHTPRPPVVRPVVLTYALVIVLGGVFWAALGVLLW